MSVSNYRGRIAPTPSGYLHLGHARTFWMAAERARRAGGVLIYRNEDLDAARCRAEFEAAALEDLRWLGLRWGEGPDVGGAFGPYNQRARISWYVRIWKQLLSTDLIYPSQHSRKDVEEASVSAAADGEEPLFPTSLRPRATAGVLQTEPGIVNWRFRVPDGLEIRFEDGRLGDVVRTAGKDFGDFLVWRKDGFPSYELAVVADDHAMQISEVVRGEDLLTSAARQILLYQALGWTPPEWFHCPLIFDEHGRKLSKSTGSVSLRGLRLQGATPENLRGQWQLP